MAEKSPIMCRLDRNGAPLLVVRVLLGAYFVYMGLSKVQDPFVFLKLIRQYEMMPETPAIFLNATAVVLPWLEIIAGTALVLGLLPGGAAATIAIMLVVFTPAIFLRAMSIHQAEGTPFFDIAFDCGCGGGPVIIWQKLLTNSGLLVLAVLVMVSRSRRFCLDLWFDRRRARSAYCRGCGYPLSDGDESVCTDCRAARSYPAGTAEAAG